jgi:hypothetical protein
VLGHFVVREEVVNILKRHNSSTFHPKREDRMFLISVKITYQTTPISKPGS